MPTARHRRAQQRNRLTPEIVDAIAGGITGIELNQMLQLRRGETLASVARPIAVAALAAGQERLESFLGRRLHTGELQCLQRWAGEVDRPPPLVEES